VGGALHLLQILGSQGQTISVVAWGSYLPTFRRDRKEQLGSLFESQRNPALYLERGRLFQDEQLRQKLPEEVLVSTLETVEGQMILQDCCCAAQVVEY
jgi:hypothetical protein